MSNSSADCWSEGSESSQYISEGNSGESYSFSPYTRSSSPNEIEAERESRCILSGLVARKLTVKEIKWLLMTMKKAAALDYVKEWMGNKEGPFQSLWKALKSEASSRRNDCVSKKVITVKEVGRNARDKNSEGVGQKGSCVSGPSVQQGIERTIWKFPFAISSVMLLFQTKALGHTGGGKMGEAACCTGSQL